MKFFDRVYCFFYALNYKFIGHDSSYRWYPRMMVASMLYVNALTVRSLGEFALKRRIYDNVIIDILMFIVIYYFYGKSVLSRQKELESNCDLKLYLTPFLYIIGSFVALFFSVIYAFEVR